jgi:hypothetical protein
MVETAGTEAQVSEPEVELGVMAGQASFRTAPIARPAETEALRGLAAMAREARVALLETAVLGIQVELKERQERVAPALRGRRAKPVAVVPATPPATRAKMVVPEPRLTAATVRQDSPEVVAPREARGNGRPDSATFPPGAARRAAVGDVSRALAHHQSHRNELLE